MPLKISVRNEAEVPSAACAAGSAEFSQIKAELAKLEPAWCSKVDAGSQKALKGTKAMLTRAGNQIGRPVTHWQAEPWCTRRQRTRPVAEGVRRR